VDKVYQVELEILYSILPSLLSNSQKSLQEGFGQVLTLTACKVGNSKVQRHYTVFTPYTGLATL
jgi:hypothetical protein